MNSASLFAFGIVCLTLIISADCCATCNGTTPAGGTPAGGTPAGATPAGGTPAGGTPAGGTPANCPCPSKDGILNAVAGLLKGANNPLQGVVTGLSGILGKPVTDALAEIVNQLIIALIGCTPA